MNDRESMAIADLLERAYFHHERSRLFGTSDSAVEDLRQAVADLANAVSRLLPAVTAAAGGH